MTFGKILTYLENGEYARRTSWEVGIAVALQRPDAESLNTKPYLYRLTPVQERMPWQPDNEDLFAEDWEIVEV